MMCMDFTEGWCGHMKGFKRDFSKDSCDHVWQNKGRSLVIGDAYRVVCYWCHEVIVTDLKGMKALTKEDR